MVTILNGFVRYFEKSSVTLRDVHVIVLQYNNALLSLLQVIFSGYRQPPGRKPDSFACFPVVFAVFL
jgi:hypothetical protein